MSAAFIEAHRKRRRFSTDELRALMEEGVTQTEAARRLGVTQSAVAQRLFSEGIDWPKRKRREVDAATFERLWRCHTIGTHEIAEWIGISRQAVSDRAKRMGLPQRAKNRRKLSNDDELRELWLAGVCVKDIAAHFGYAHPSAVGVAVRNLGLPPRHRGKGTKFPNGWVGTISLYDYQQQKLGELMARKAREVKP